MAKRKDQQVIRIHDPSTPNLEQWQARIQAWNEAPQRQFARMRSAATETLKPFVTDVQDGGELPGLTMFKHDLGEGLRSYQMKDDAPRRAVIALRVLHDLHNALTPGDEQYRFYFMAKAAERYASLIISKDRAARGTTAKSKRKEERQRQAVVIYWDERRAGHDHEKAIDCGCKKLPPGKRDKRNRTPHMGQSTFDRLIRAAGITAETPMPEES